MNSKKQNICEVCKKKMSSRKLHPLSLARSSIIKLIEENYPEVNLSGRICYADLRKLNSEYYEDMLIKERGKLSELEKEVLDSIGKHQILSSNSTEDFQQQSTLGERVADQIAQFGGSWGFILFFVFTLVTWMSINTLSYFGTPFDPYPYILLNLVLSCLAAIQAPVIMMSQNRQAKKDRISQDNDYQTNLKAELQIRQLTTRLELFSKNTWEKLYEIRRVQEQILEALEKESQ